MNIFIEVINKTTTWDEHSEEVLLMTDIKVIIIRKNNLKIFLAKRTA